MERLHQAHQKGEVLTGVFYVNAKADVSGFAEYGGRTAGDTGAGAVRPPKEALEAAMAEFGRLSFGKCLLSLFREIVIVQSRSIP